MHSWWVWKKWPRFDSSPHSRLAWHLSHLCFACFLTSHNWVLTNKIVNSVAHHVCGLGGAVEPEVFGHCLLLLGGLAHLLQDTGKHRDESPPTKTAHEMVLCYVLVLNNRKCPQQHPDQDNLRSWLKQQYQRSLRLPKKYSSKSNFDFQSQYFKMKRTNSSNVNKNNQVKSKWIKKS